MSVSINTEVAGGASTGGSGGGGLASLNDVTTAAGTASAAEKVDFLESVGAAAALDSYAFQAGDFTADAVSLTNDQLAATQHYNRQLTSNFTTAKTFNVQTALLGSTVDGDQISIVNSGTSWIEFGSSNITVPSGMTRRAWPGQMLTGEWTPAGFISTTPDRLSTAMRSLDGSMGWRVTATDNSSAAFTVAGTSWSPTSASDSGTVSLVSQGNTPAELAIYHRVTYTSAAPAGTSRRAAPTTTLFPALYLNNADPHRARWPLVGSFVVADNLPTEGAFAFGFWDSQGGVPANGAAVITTNSSGSADHVAAGFAFESGDTNLKIFMQSGTSTAFYIDLGASWSKASIVNSADVLDFVIDRNAAGTEWYFYARKRTTGTEYWRVVTSADGTVIPAANRRVRAFVFRDSATAGSAVVLHMHHMSGGAIL